MGPAEGALTGNDRPSEEREAPPDRRLSAAARSTKQLVLDHRYLLLSAALLLLVVVHTLKRRVPDGTDLWEHLAAARELGARPLDPNHPLFPLDRPHQLMSPYHLVLGLASRLPGLSIVTVFHLAGIANVLLLLAGLRLFVTRLLGRRHVEFYALLFILFLWGPGAWFYSGFFHFNVLPWVLSYPSTFAKALAFVGLALHLRFLDGGDRRALVATAAIGTVVLLAHPVDGVFYFVAIGALALTRPRERRLPNLVATGLASSAAVGLAFVWPYFSLFDLVFGAANETYRTGLAAGDREMYRNVLWSIWPALIAVPFVLRRLLRNRDDPLLVLLCGLLVLYTYGWVSEQWVYGRLISAIMVVVAVIVADELAGAAEEARAFGGAGRGAARWIQFSALALVAAGMVQMRHGLIMLPDSVLERLPDGVVVGGVGLAPTAEFSFLSRYVGAGKVVLSESHTSMQVPAYGGKVVGVSAPEAFVDTAERSADVGRFFDPSATEAVRRAIIAKHDVAFLLLRQSGFDSDAENYRAMAALGRVAHVNSRFVLVDLRQPEMPAGD